MTRRLLAATASAAALALALTAPACGDRVERYPDVDDDAAEGTTGGEGEPVRRAQPPQDTGGPHPQDDLAGEETEPL
jgi:hypothetical protein